MGKMMARKDFVGEHHDHITVLRKLDEKASNGRSMFLCRCDCGKEFKTSISCVHTVKSCGCMTKEYIARGQRTHGESKTKLYDIWHRMKERCYRKGHKSYADYGGRGIVVCDEWKNNFIAFRDWALANGYTEDAEFMECTLDRIDVNGNYEPSNCRWVNMKVQCNDRRNNHVLTYNGESHTISEWSEITGIPFCTLWRRWKRGWDDEKIISEPLRRTKAETLSMMLEVFCSKEIVTKEDFDGIICDSKVLMYISELRMAGYNITQEWVYHGKPSGFMNRHIEYRLEG